MIAAFAMFYILASITRLWKAGKTIRFFSDISFEVYLYHYMFCVGPIRLFGLTDSWIMDSIVIIIITIAISFLMNNIAKLIIKKILK